MQASRIPSIGGGGGGGWGEIYCFLGFLRQAYLGSSCKNIRNYGYDSDIAMQFSLRFVAFFPTIVEPGHVSGSGIVVVVHRVTDVYRQCGLVQVIYLFNRCVQAVWLGSDHLPV